MLLTESRSVTDSVGSHSDASGHTTVTSHQVQRPRMDVVCVIDVHQPEHLTHRKRALDEVRQACVLVNANMNHIQVCFFICEHLN
jgi:mitogen-activated protein kinase kinase kinase 5